MAEKKILPYVDILKFVFAVLIFLLHMRILSLIPYYSVTQAFTVRLAVPFFFVASGYFFANKLRTLQSIDEKKTATWKYCMRLVIKLFVFEPISIIILTAGRFVVEHMAPDDILIITIKEILFYPRGALWYIQAMIVAALLLFPLVHSGKEKNAIIPAVMLYVIALLGNRYYFLVDGTFLGLWMDRYESIFITVRNGVFVAFPFMLFGCLIAKYQDRLKNWNGRAPLLLIGLAVVLFESLLMRSCEGHDDNSLYLSYLFAVPALFSFAAFLPARHMLAQKTIVLRHLSTSIYLLHSPIGRIVKYAMGYFMQESVLLNGMIAATCIGGICLIVYKTRWKPFYGWLI